MITDALGVIGSIFAAIKKKCHSRTRELRSSAKIITMIIN